MGIQFHLRKKLTLIPNNTIQKNPHKITNNYQEFPFYIITTIPNFFATISKAIKRNDNLFAILLAIVYVGFVLFRLCFSKYISLPKHEKLIKEFWLKLDVWFLYTVITFGFVYQFADFVHAYKTTVSMYILVSFCSLLLFAVLVVIDVVKFCKIWRDGGEDETRLPENQMVDAGELNYCSVNICDKV